MRLDPSAQGWCGWVGGSVGGWVWVWVSVGVCVWVGGCVCICARTLTCTHTLSAQWCLTLCDSMDCSPPGSSDHGIFQVRIIEWVAIFSSRGSSRPRDQTCISCLVGRLFTPVPPGKYPSRLQFIKHYVSKYTQVKNYKR